MKLNWKLNRFTVLIAIGLLVVVTGIILGGVGIVVATGGSDETEPPITGDALEQAGAAALAHTGGGRVTETEIGDEDGYYEVEVTLDDGRQIDVHLDQNFQVISQEADGPDDSSEADDD